ncbi:hypothetical protein BI335_16000 [Enemella evansiae]|nr:hypothetical protein BI335_16000 [Enemella evansiae]
MGGGTGAAGCGALGGGVDLAAGAVPARHRGAPRGRGGGLRAAYRCLGRGLPPVSSPPPVSSSELLPALPPFDFRALLGFLGVRVVTGVEYADENTFARTVRLPGGPAVLRLTGRPDGVELTCWLSDPADLAEARTRAGALCDLAADPSLIDPALARVPALAGLVADHPGIRIPGTLDRPETAVRGLLGQQISLAGATRAAERLVDEHGDPLPEELRRAGEPFGLTALFPTSARIAAVDPARFAMPGSRQRALHTLAAAVEAGTVDLTDPDLDRVRKSLLALKGIGPWTAGYILLRACGDPDVWLDSDLVLRREAEARGITAEQLRPVAGWRSYASLQLWRAAAERRR